MLNFISEVLNILGGMLLAAFVLWDRVKVIELLDSLKHKFAYVILVSIRDESVESRHKRLRDIIAAAFYLCFFASLLIEALALFSLIEGISIVNNLNHAARFIADTVPLLYISIILASIVFIAILRFYADTDHAERRIAWTGVVFIVLSSVIDSIFNNNS